MAASHLTAGILVLIVLGNQAPENDAFELKRIQFSIVHLEDSAGELNAHGDEIYEHNRAAGEDKAPSDEKSPWYEDVRSRDEIERKPKISLQVPTNKESEGAESKKFVADTEYRERHGASMSQVGKDGVPLDKEIFDGQGHPRIDVKQNTLGTDRDGKTSGIVDDRKLEPVPQYKVNLDKFISQEEERPQSEDEEKTRKILKIPEYTNPAAHECSRETDLPQRKLYIPEGQIIGNSERQSGTPILSNGNGKAEITGNAPAYKRLDSSAADRNTQLNIDQTKAKDPMTILDTNKNYGLQQYIEKQETNINNNLFLNHKIQRRDVEDQACTTTTTPCPTTTTTCPTTTTPCPTTTTPCPTTTTPCPTTTTPCPTTTTTCPTTTTPCPTTTTTCPTTTTPCPTTTTTCPTTTTPCPTTTTPCPTTTTPCPTTTTTCPTTTTPCPTTTTPCPTTEKPC